MNFTTETKVFLGIIVVSILIIIGSVFAFTKAPEPIPTIPREQLITSEAQLKGNASASAYLVEFSDFQCPSCKAAHPFVNEAMNKYKDNLLFAYRHFPLTQHPFAEKAAIAAEAAGRQGKFWEAHDYLFTNQDKFSDEFLLSLGKALTLDETKFTADFSDIALKNKVQQDLEAALALGVNSTPTFYLNGQKLNVNSYADLDVIIGSVLTTQ